MGTRPTAPLRPVLARLGLARLGLARPAVAAGLLAGLVAVLIVALLAGPALTGGVEARARTAEDQTAPSRIIADSIPPARHREPESGLPPPTPLLGVAADPMGANTLDPASDLPLGPTGDVGPAASLVRTDAPRPALLTLPEDLWTALAVVAGLCALVIAGLVGARLGGGARAVGRDETLSTRRRPSGVAAALRRDARLRRALETARRQIVLADVLGPPPAPEAAGVDPARLVLELSPARRQARALARAAARGAVTRPVRPLGFTYAPARRARLRRAAAADPSAAARNAAQAMGSPGGSAMAAPVPFPAALRAPAPLQTPRAAIAEPTVSPPRQGDGGGPETRQEMQDTQGAKEADGQRDKGDRISNVIRGIAAFDARHRGHPRDRR